MGMIEAGGSPGNDLLISTNKLGQFTWVFKVAVCIHDVKGSTSAHRASETSNFTLTQKADR